MNETMVAMSYSLKKNFPRTRFLGHLLTKWLVCPSANFHLIDFDAFFGFGGTCRYALAVLRNLVGVKRAMGLGKLWTAIRFPVFLANIWESLSMTNFLIWNFILWYLTQVCTIAGQIRTCNRAGQKFQQLCLSFYWTYKFRTSNGSRGWTSARIQHIKFCLLVMWDRKSKNATLIIWYGFLSNSAINS